jgi:endoglycosylceramidase
MAHRSAHAVVVAALSVFLFSVVAVQGGPLHVNGQFFQDASGRVVILRGVNVASNSRTPPFTPITNVTQLNPLPGWGINVIRLLFDWEPYEPGAGQFAPQYLAYINSIVDAAWARGIYVIIDFHEGAFSRYLAGGCGNGFPAWAIPPGVPLSAPDNSEHCENWQQVAFADPRIPYAFTQFYANTYGVRTQFLNLWQTLAQNFLSHPGVIGYDIINEPWGLEPTQIFPLYQDAATVIHAVDPTAIVFFEPRINVGQGTQTSLPGSPSPTNAAYAPHFYDPSLALGAWSGDPATTNTAFANMVSAASSLNVPVFLGEFGVQVSVANLGPYMDLLYQNLNSNLFSGTQWSYTPGWTPLNWDGYNGENYSIVDNQGNLRPNFKVRPYPQKISGTPTQLTVSSDGTSTQLLWNHSQQTGGTVLFVPRSTLFGSTPVKIVTQGSNLACGYDSTQTFVVCVSNVDGPKTVTVRPCNMNGGVCQ